MAKRKYTYYDGVALPETAKLMEGEDGKSDSVSIKVRIVAGPQAGVEKTWYGVLGGGATEITIQALRTMGWRCSDITALEGLGSTIVTVAEYDDDFGGKVRKRISIFEKRAPKATVSDENKAAFAAKFKAIAAATKVVEISDINRAPEVLPDAVGEVEELAAPLSKDPWA